MVMENVRCKRRNRFTPQDRLFTTTHVTKLSTLKYISHVKCFWYLKNINI